MIGCAKHRGWTCTQAGCESAPNAEQQRNCEHEGAETLCGKCGMSFIVCPPCSEAGGTVRHAPPACEGLRHTEPTTRSQP